MAFGFIGFRHSDSIKTAEGMWKKEMWHTPRRGANRQQRVSHNERSLSPTVERGSNI